MNYDIFNGDADGICALHQLRLAEPCASQLITGVKRDIQLLSQVKEASHSRLTVLDISMEANKADLLRLLEGQNQIRYFDHHSAGEIPQSPLLEAFIDLSPQVCTSLLVDRFLGGEYRLWAIVAAFGDNLHGPACQLAQEMGLGATEVSQLRELGELINYNGYGEALEDLHLPPADLYQSLSGFREPLEFYRTAPALQRLREGFAADLTAASAQKPFRENATGRVFCFPAEPWSVRVAGIFSNEMARQAPELAHALLVARKNGEFLVSVRAPLQRPQGADALCRQFRSGGGRAAAAGINHLPKQDLETFLNAFERVFTSSL